MWIDVKNFVGTQFLLVATLVITCGYGLENHHNPPDIMTPLNSHQNYDQLAWNAVLSSGRSVENKWSQLNPTGYRDSMDLFQRHALEKIETNSIRPKSIISRDTLRKYKAKHHKKVRGRRVRKNRARSRGNFLPNFQPEEIFQSASSSSNNKAQLSQDNVEHELTKNLENEIIKLRLNNFFINPSTTQDTTSVLYTRKTSESPLENLQDADLSCINGKFIPAPLVPHSLIKYVKSSRPGHEYLEADYECIPGFVLLSNTSRLLCKNREWIGDLPSCVIKSQKACSSSKCDQLCEEVDNVAVCSCLEGFQLRNNKCIDIDECSGVNGCHFTCVNTPGSFHCDCPAGMTPSDDDKCTDIDECAGNNGRGPCQDTCQNLEGGYICSCDNLPGTSLSADNHTCQDASPCDLDNAGCSHTCLSTGGRVFCLCPDGFMLQDDWKTCQDVDECAVPDLQTSICRYGCVNTPGSYRCVDPTELKNQITSSDQEYVCPPGYEASIESACVDVNECEKNNGGCSEVCENTQGSYFCACNGDEKILSPDGRSCLDINLITCPPLPTTTKGTLICSRQTARNGWSPHRAASRPGTKCYLKCPRAYQLLGEYQLTCRTDGSWDGGKTGECVKLIRPHLECPRDVVAQVAPGTHEAFVKFNQPVTDVDWFRYVRSRPSWGMRLEANLKPGMHVVMFFAQDPVTKKQSTCALRINVLDDTEKSNNCLKTIVEKNGTSIRWTKATPEINPPRPSSGNC